MADHKHKTHAKDEQPAAYSVDRAPDGEPTPVDPGLPVDPQDEPKGQPTSDRFHTEQAHRSRGKDK
jgi:hypothetical protein